MLEKTLLSSLTMLLLALPGWSQQSTDESLRLVLEDIQNRLFVNEKEAVQELAELIGKWKSMDVPHGQRRSFLLGAADYYTMKVLVQKALGNPSKSNCRDCILLTKRRIWRSLKRAPTWLI